MTDQLTPEQIEQAKLRVRKQGYFHRVLAALDQLGNAAFGGNPSETISARSERARKRGDWRGKLMVWWLNKIQPQHGELAVVGSWERAEEVEQAEEKDLGMKK